MNPNDEAILISLTNHAQPEYDFTNGYAVIKAINTVQQEISELGGIEKTRSSEKPKSNYNNNNNYNNNKSTFGSYMYRGIEDIYNVLSPLMAKHNLVCIPHVERCEVAKYTNAKGDVVFKSVALLRYIFLSSQDGSTIKVSMVGEANDNGDKGISKAITAAHKRLFEQTFAIPTCGDNDPDATYHSDDGYMPPPSPPQKQPRTVSNQAPAQQNNLIDTPAHEKAFSNNRVASPELKQQIDSFMRQHNNALSEVLKQRNININKISEAELIEIGKEFRQFVGGSVAV